VVAALAVLDALNSREKAGLLWLLVLVVVAGIRSDGFRASLLDVFRSLASPKLLAPFAVAGLYSAGLVFLAHRLGLWHTTALKATVYWFFGTGVVLVGAAIMMARDDPGYVVGLLRRALKLTILVEFLVNLYVFPFFFELVFVPFVSLFVLMQVWDQYNPTQPTVRKFINSVLAVIGLSLFAYVLARIASDPSGFFSRETAEDFVVAPTLTVALLPYLFLVGWYCEREQKNLRKRWEASPNY
jgi:hypothetical protein